ncbi:MAG: cytochrome d ubiquinol oxidase subunit II [Betaproteobacteria bacterium]|nr:cytochrome d ubiquinol oxidase subunit II [Betaproteobacteria bacterium]NBP11498.1 cytochrome d ubiquinol oxidase subunit II [Betaproteobacteria bacterium]NBP62983.1 cytochrome d ubiquinol oxidase subunit II [Betaproteobacteria bacterium]NBQ10094.1 cytochrome d ubiquinol oxidase subunit II [Betaproteobacteria bacterium]NBS22205.1 cytochrome d ubiquinol oxidase subunit II [Betaproteobacteria bacterium]
MLDTAIDLASPAGWLPLAFALVMALAMLAYVILDGYDLGVGLLLLKTPEVGERNSMVASIGPFWDANETWLVLGVGVLLVAFPQAHGVILGALYLPVAFMLVGLTLRGVAFDFRLKAQTQQRPLWDAAFHAGSLVATWSQGYMLGQLITGFRSDVASMAFSALIGLCLIGAYRLLGATWLIMKSKGALQLKAVAWARASLLMTVVGVFAISLVTPLVSQRIFDKWFSFIYPLILFPIPLSTAVLFVVIHRSLAKLPVRLANDNPSGAGVPFSATVGVFLLAFGGLGYSLFPWLVVDRITIWQGTSSTESLWVILIGTVIVLPVIVGYTIYTYRVFWGKSESLSY